MTEIPRITDITDTHNETHYSTTSGPVMLSGYLMALY